MKHSVYMEKKIRIIKMFFILLMSILIIKCVVSSINENKIKDYKEDENRDITLLESIPKDYKTWGIRAINYTNENLSSNSYKKIKIAILDSGINQAHQELREKVKEMSNFTKSNSKDNLNHGTPIAGILASNNKLKGILGNLEIYSAKIINDDGTIHEDSVIDAINWAIEKDVDIINMSFGFRHNSAKLEKAINLAIQNNILIVASAGNKYGLNTDYPARYRDVISVGSINSNLELSKFNPVDKIDFVAPGEKILSASNLGGYKLYVGSSFSTPFVTGVIGRCIIDKNIKKDENRLSKVYNYLLENSISIKDNFNIIQLIRGDI
ncbi:S8 family serine peptidase [Romboutsia lituseburensis]|uniref:S8 family serine peptidase n=1 Tax=Romboutsia lituseburensis TaxID=1537 RepID=UPI00215AAAD6|nr:S8 family serine peptidase [Romboutsia lituseburensis]MCR8745757.1 S8 family serine peptidase [Romboutsia lituseburensis]